MSLDGGDVSNCLGAQATPSAMEEDYCLHGRERFQHQWSRAGTFAPAALRVYGVTGEPVLMRAVKQARMLSAAFATCFLGALPSSEPSAPTGAPRSCGGLDALPFGSLLLGPCPPASVASSAVLLEQAWRREVAGAWSALHTPSEWCQAVSGVVAEAGWSTQAQRHRIAEQLDLAAFMCLRAVQVPLPCYTGDGDADGDGPAADAAEEDQRNIRAACLAADVLLPFIQRSAGVRVWVRCDACIPAHRYQLQRLRHALLYGYSTYSADTPRPAATLYRIHTPRSVTGATTSSAPTASPSTSLRSDVVHTEAAAALQALLYFSVWQPRMSLPSEWFGEDVVAFMCPTAPALLASLAPHGVTPQEHPHYRAGAAGERPTGAVQRDDSAAAPLRRSSAMHAEEDVAEETWVLEDGSARSRTAAADDDAGEVVSNVSPMDYSLGDWYDGVGELDTSHGAASSSPARGERGARSSLSSGAASSSEAAGDCRRSQVLRHRYVFTMPADAASMSASRWAGAHPPYVSALAFLTELLRRRAMPVFDRSFFDQYPLLNYVYFKAVEEPTRDVFAAFEGQLQLPLQPLSHHLSSGVYEVFERDARKYSQYREAVFHYVRDWCAAGAERQHALMNAAFFARCGVVQPVPVPATDERTLHVVLLGSGRGPLIDECLNAVSALGVRLRIFAVEKNAPAAAFTRMRWENDPEWMQLARTFGHTLAVIVADGRTLAETAAAALPADFGLCDLVVSELLGSLGDNELSPECLEAFRTQLESVQHRRGIVPNPHLTCIPQRYTAWVAPLMSATFEAAVTEAAVRGLTVPPPGCPDHHAALDHSLLVTNLGRAVVLAPPQPCWEFEHNFGSGSGKRERDTAAARRASTALERSAELVFVAAPYGRCSGIVGYFSAVLYESPTSPATVLSTAPAGRTEDMYSWFPCVFALEPGQRAELHEVEHAAAHKSGTVAIHVRLDRKTSVAERRAWYEWSVRYGDAVADASASPSAGCDGAVTTPVVHNKGGWASSMLL